MDLNEFFGPNPNRPDSPDFWRLSEIILEMDGALQAVHSEDEKEQIWDRFVTTYVTPNSIYYLGLQRAFRAIGVTTIGEAREHFDVLIKMCTLYTEAFAVGCQYMERGGKP